MKRKLNARTITLISLIAALICAVLAGFALIDLFNVNSGDRSNSIETDAYIASPEKNVTATAVAPTVIDGLNYDDDDYSYWIEYYERVKLNGVVVNETIALWFKADKTSYPVEWFIEGVDYKITVANTDYSYIQVVPLEAGDMRIYARNTYGETNDVRITIYASIQGPVTIMGDYSYWVGYSSGVMQPGETQTLYAYTNNSSITASRIKWDISGYFTIVSGGNGSFSVTIRATDVGLISFFADFGPAETDTSYIRSTYNFVGGAVWDTGSRQMYWQESESQTMKVGETQTIYYYTTDMTINESAIMWTKSFANVKLLAGGDGFNYLTFEAVKVGTVSAYEINCAPTETDSITIRIEKGDYDMSNVSWDYSSAFTYDGNTKTVSLTGLPEGVTANYSNNSKSAAGTYTASVSSWNYDSTNYNEPSSVNNLSWTINRASINAPTLNKTSVTYSQSSQTFTISSVSYMTVTLPSGWSRSGTTVTIPGGTSVGSYNISVTPDSNHQWSSGSSTTSARTLSISINRAGISQPTLSASSVTYSQSSQTFTISSVSYMTVTLPSGWSRSGTTITIPGGTSVGSYNISVTPDSNHQWSSGSSTTSARTLSISITAASVSSATINLSQTSLVYTSGELKPTVTSVTIGSTTVPSSDYTISYSNNIIVGTATVTITAKNNYTGTCSTTFTITKATPTANPTVSAGTYVAGNPLSTVGITGTGSVSGTFYWTDPSTLLTLGSASYEWTFEPADTHNYNNVTGKATVAAVGMDYITVTGAKVKYKAYESFTQTGMVVNAVAGSTSRPVTGYTLEIPYTQDGRNYFLVSDSGCEITVTYSEGGKTATTTIVITVEKADYDMTGVSMPDTTVTYDGNAHSVTYTGELPTGVHFNRYTYDGTAVTGVTNAGTYTVAVQFTIDDGDNYNVPELSATLIINKATPTATANILSGTYYVGDVLSGVTISVGTSSVGGTISWTNGSGTITGLADSYGWTFVPVDTDNYNNVTGVAQVNAYYKLTGITVSGAKTTYKAHESFDTTGMVVTASYAVGQGATAVTGYTVSYPTAGATEFVISDDGKSMTVTYTENGKTATAQITITIIANEYDMTGVVMTDITVTYDGQIHSITYTGSLPDGVTVTGYTYNGTSGTGASNAGTYEVKAVIVISDPDNYKLPELKATLIINKAQGVIDVTGVKTNYVYTGSLQTVDSGATVDNSEQTIVYTNNTFTTVADGNGLVVSITVAESDNYLGATETVTLTVSKATPTLDVTGVKTDYVYTGSLQTVDSGATVDNSEQTIVYTNNTFTTVADGDGLVVSITVAESANYFGDSQTVTLTVD
ncbi:MAG: MBG domain-containing protein, partial [Clostridia bacterium]|nr:MBG domain-containing protein [Clostridia bacterium]